VDRLRIHLYLRWVDLGERVVPNVASWHLAVIRANDEIRPLRDKGGHTFSWERLPSELLIVPTRMSQSRALAPTHRAQRRSLSLDSFGPHRITNGAIAIGAE